MRAESRVLVNALLSYGSRAIAIVVGLLMVPYLISQLGTEGYGAIGIVTALLGLMVLVELGLRPAASRQFTHFLFGGDPERANQLASTALAIYLGLGVVLLLAAAAAGAPFLRILQLPPELLAETRIVLLIVAGSLALVLARAPYEAALASQLRYDIPQYCDAAGTVLRAAFVVATFSWLGPSLILWAVPTLLWSGIALAIHRWQAHRHCPSLHIGLRLVSRRGAADLTGLGAFAGLMRLAQWLAESSGPLIISAWLGPESVAYYMPAVVLVLALNPLSRAFLGQLTPVVTRAWAEDRSDMIRRVLVRSTRYSVLAGGAAVALVASLALPLVPVWLGPGFDVTAWVLIAWAARSLLQAAAGGSFAVFMGSGRLGAVTALNVVLALAGVGASVYLVARTELGVIGPALAMLGAQVLRSVGWFALATRYADVPRGPYLREAFAGPLTAIALMVTVSLAAQRALDASPLVELLVAGVSGGAVFAGLGWSIGLNAEDRGRVRGYLGLGLRFARGVLRGRSPPGGA